MRTVIIESPFAGRGYQNAVYARLAIGAKLDATVVYTDYGVTPGMRQGIDAAERAGRPVEYRSLILGDEIATIPTKNGEKRS